MNNDQIGLVTFLCLFETALIIRFWLLPAWREWQAEVRHQGLHWWEDPK